MYMYLVSGKVICIMEFLNALVQKRLLNLIFIQNTHTVNKNWIVLETEIVCYFVYLIFNTFNSYTI